jgi:hypothetical protein
MQNKANLQDAQMNASHVKTKSYEQKTMNCEPTKQSQTNPIKANRKAGSGRAEYNL